MKKGLMLYILFAVIFLIALYFTTTAELIVRTQNTFNDQLFLESKTTNDFEGFVKYQTEYYKMLDKIDEEDYSFHFYHILIEGGIDNFFVVVNPISNNIKHATSKDDPNDHSRVVLNGLTNEYDTRNIKDAISYGYNENQIGFMFYNLEITNNDQIEFSYYDYENNLIMNKTINITKVDEVELLSFNKGITIEEIKELMNLDEIIDKALRKRLLIYLSVVIFAPFIYLVIKRVKLNKK